MVRKLYKTGECGSVTDEVIKEGVVIAVVSVTHSNLHSCAEVPASQVEGQPQALQVGGQTQPLQMGGQPQALQMGGQTQALQFGGQTQALQFGGQPHPLQMGGQPQSLQMGGQTQPLQTMQTHLGSSVAGEWCSLSCVVCVGLSQSAYMRVCVCRGIAWMWSVLLSLQIIQTISCSSEHM